MNVLNVKPFTVAKVSVNRNGVIPPKTKRDLENVKVDFRVSPMLTPTLNGPKGSQSLMVFVQNSMKVDGIEIGSYDATTCFDLFKDWGDYSENEKVLLIHLAWHTATVMFQTECWDNGPSFAPLPMLDTTKALAAIQNVPISPLF
jgi:hypothetical protein